MPLAVATTRRVAIDVNGEIVVFVCRTPSAPELSQFLNGRFETKRNKVNSRVYEAREAFINKILIDVENAQRSGPGLLVRHHGHASEDVEGPDPDVVEEQRRPAV
jgi:hypothetical protein